MSERCWFYIAFASVVNAIFILSLTGTLNAQENPAIQTCKGWNTKLFFQKVTATDVAQCLKAGADPHTKNKKGASPLHYAAAFTKSSKIITTLLKAGTNLNERDKAGKTPLHWAATHSKAPEVVELLLHSRAAPALKDNNGNTPWNYAKANAVLRNTEVYQWLAYSHKRQAERESDEIRKRELTKKQKRLEKDSFQQFINYFITGNPFKSDGGIAKSKIFDRKNCVAGFEDNNGGYMKIYWNNVDVNSIRIQDKFQGEWQKYISFSGHPYVLDIEFKDLIIQISYAANGITNGQHSAVSIPLGALDEKRLVKAFRLLYSKHCRGLKRKSAF